MHWYFEVLKKYSVFDGRAHRTEYWMFVLVNVIISFVLEMVLGDPGVLAVLYSLAVLVPSIAVSVRRLHDIGRSGWWLLVGVIPVVGGIVLLVFAVQDSQLGDNQYGPNPKDTPSPSDPLSRRLLDDSKSRIPPFQ